MSGVGNPDDVRRLTSLDRLLQTDPHLRVLDDLQLPLSAAQITRLRDRWGVETADWVASLGELQRKASEKLGPPGPGQSHWVVTARALQQSSDAYSAAYKANRFPGGATIIDVCCGIGADAIALRQRGPLLAIDADPLIARMAAYNLQTGDHLQTAYPAQVVAGLAERVLSVSEDRRQPVFLHIDPDRRPGDRRATDPRRYQPALEDVLRWFSCCDGGVVKLAPAATVPLSLPLRYHREWISLGGSVRQQLLWIGKLAGAEPPYRSATTLDAQSCHVTFTASPQQSGLPEATAPLRWVIDLDPAIRAAGLSVAFARQHGWFGLCGPQGFFTTDSREVPSPLAKAYEVVWSGPADVKTLKRVAAERGRLLLEIKVRGTEHDPDDLRRRLRSKRTVGGQPATLLVGRGGGRVFAAIADPAPPRHPTSSNNRSGDASRRP